MHTNKCIPDVHTETKKHSSHAFTHICTWIIQKLNKTFDFFSENKDCVLKNSLPIL